MTLLAGKKSRVIFRNFAYAFKAYLLQSFRAAYLLQSFRAAYLLQNVPSYEENTARAPFFLLVVRLEQELRVHLKLAERRTVKAIQAGEPFRLRWTSKSIFNWSMVTSL